ncbi:hypothetical protein CDAR_16111 [Caerostris darwini]|uniref:Uncharacterized protein n=1 Tax=Caerostris darwini TaxID=1538125 RepID=A0AAV4UT63_9ARAC|nr:hypothetical protein CDAR_16111 [Caerostris darwini]
MKRWASILIIYGLQDAVTVTHSPKITRKRSFAGAVLRGKKTLGTGNPRQTFKSQKTIFFLVARIPQSRYILKNVLYGSLYVFSTRIASGADILWFKEYHLCHELFVFRTRVLSPSCLNTILHNSSGACTSLPGKQMLQDSLAKIKKKVFSKQSKNQMTLHKLFFIPIPLLTIPAECVPNGKTDVAGILLQDKEASFLQAIQEPDDASHKGIIILISFVEVKEAIRLKGKKIEKTASELLTKLRE